MEHSFLFFHYQALLEKLLYSGGQFYSARKFLASRKKFKLNLPLYSGRLFSGKIKITVFDFQFYLTQVSVFKFGELFNFSRESP